MCSCSTELIGVERDIFFNSEFYDFCSLARRIALARGIHIFT